MDKHKEKQAKKMRRKLKVRAKISGTSKRPRLAVFRSSKYIYVQLIDDQKQSTLAHVDSRKVEGNNKIERATAVGKAIAEKAKEKKIENVVFDRGGFQYHGRVKALAEAAREAGLKF